MLRTLFTQFIGGDDLVAMGTQKECAETLGVKPQYIHWLTTPTGKKRLASRKNPEKCMTALIVDWE